jgi:hypothetical protein
MYIGEGILKFFHFKFLGMDMPCGASLIIVGFEHYVCQFELES